MLDLYNTLTISLENGNYIATVMGQDGGSVGLLSIFKRNLPVLLAQIELLQSCNAYGGGHYDIVLDKSMALHQVNGCKALKLPNDKEIGFEILPTSEWGTCVIRYCEKGKIKMQAGPLDQILYSIAKTGKRRIVPRNFCKYLDQQPK